jgi:hypothetical protein
MNNEDMFARLVENALDFLSKAISELSEQPKYSVIHFHAAMELFLKARLMYEHWSLVVAKGQDPDWDKFITGDFQSISLDEAANRLTKIVRSGLPGAAMQSFKAIAQHRNKAVHFFHEAHSVAESDELKRNIVRQQLKAWYFLHQLLREQWKKEFSKWNREITWIDEKLREQHEFLQVVFDNLEAEIKDLKQKGFLIACCPSCGFDAQLHEDELYVLYDAECKVCGFGDKCIEIECPKCNGFVLFMSEGFAICSCGKSYEPEDLAKILVDENHKPMDEGDFFGNCSDCDGYHTVVEVDGSDWLCTSCFQEFNSLSACDWCNDLNTGDMEFSYASGCNHCEGSAGWHKDD